MAAMKLKGRGRSGAASSLQKAKAAASNRLAVLDPARKGREPGRDVTDGEEIVIARAGKPVARLVPIEPKSKRVLGQDEGLFEVPEDFDAPLPDKVLALFQS